MSWQIRGQYIETCNCDYICPCVPSGMTESTHGTCIFAMAYRIDRGQYDGLSLDGLNFIVIGHTPGEMSAGNWNVGLIADERANPQQREALVAIVSGQGGGPMANLAPLIGKFLGVEARPIQFEGNGKSWSVAAPGLVDQALEAATGLGGETLHLDNTGHPANNRLALARAKRSHVHAFGIDWDDESGRNNGQFAPFDWSG